MARNKYTVVLDEDLAKEVKKLAIDLDMSFSELVEKVLREYLEKHKR